MTRDVTPNWSAHLPLLFSAIFALILAVSISIFWLNQTNDDNAPTALKNLNSNSAKAPRGAHPEFENSFVQEDVRFGPFGKLQVLHHKRKPMRVLRCENSILGGIWTSAQSLDELSLFGAFYLSTFVRHARSNINHVLQMCVTRGIRWNSGEIGGYDK